MAKLENLNDREKSKLVTSELAYFRELIRGHEKLLQAIGEL